MERLFIKADKAGQILAVVKVGWLPEGKDNPFYDEDDPNVDIVEIKPALVKSTFWAMEVGVIHAGYVVDAKTRALKKKKA